MALLKGGSTEICSLVKLVYAQQKGDKKMKTVGVHWVEEVTENKSTKFSVSNGGMELTLIYYLCSGTVIRMRF